MYMCQKIQSPLVSGGELGMEPSTIPKSVDAQSLIYNGLVGVALCI